MRIAIINYNILDREGSCCYQMCYHKKNNFFRLSVQYCTTCACRSCICCLLLLLLRLAGLSHKLAVIEDTKSAFDVFIAY